MVRRGAVVHGENVLRRILTRGVLAALICAGVVIGALETGIPVATANENSHGVVPLGSTNEGGSGSVRGPATGIVDIVAGPCAGEVTVATYEHLASRITLARNSRIVAQWEIYGSQQIAWVEPVGVYSMYSNQSTVRKSVRVVVSSSRVADVRLIPACK